jgi:hypothetical protein
MWYYPYNKSYLEDAINETVVDLSIGGLVHQAGAHHVEWCHRGRHEESSSEGGTKLSQDAWKYQLQSR